MPDSRGPSPAMTGGNVGSDDGPFGANGTRSEAGSRVMPKDSHDDEA